MQGTLFKRLDRLKRRPRGHKKTCTCDACWHEAEAAFLDETRPLRSGRPRQSAARPSPRVPPILRRLDRLGIRPAGHDPGCVCDTCWRAAEAAATEAVDRRAADKARRQLKRQREKARRLIDPRCHDGKPIRTHW